MSLFRFHILLILFFYGWSTPKVAEVCEYSYEIQVLHPGIDLTETFDKTLIRSTCGVDGTTEFYMDVESVVCGDSQCRIDVIRMYWDEFGFYKRLELPEDVELEKAEGASFSTADYRKLDSILSDKNSSLKDVQKYEVTGSETSEGVDALAGATIALDTKSYVKGAVWTCYTMWHWANGSIATNIRNLTGGAMNINVLRNYLDGESSQHKIFALEQLNRLQIQDGKTTQNILRLASSENYDIRKLVEEHINQLPNNQYFKSIESLFSMHNEPISLLALRILSESEKVLSGTYLDNLSNRLHDWETYQQIDLFLNILEKKGSSSQKVVSNLIPLLERDDFLIARRVFWYLSEQELSVENDKRLLNFYNKNAGKL